MCLLDGLSVCLLSFRLKNGIPGPDGADVAIEGRRGRLPFGARAASFPCRRGKEAAPSCCRLRLACPLKVVFSEFCCGE